MLQVYINYPNPLISIHGNVACANIKKMGKQAQRQITLNIGTLSAELLKFQQKGHRFASDSLSNDMWLNIDFSDQEFEREVLRYVQGLIGNHYQPLRHIKPQTHCT